MAEKAGKEEEKKDRRGYILKMDKKRLGYFEGWLSIVTNVVLFFLKLWVGSLTGSIAMVADAWHTLSDSLTSIVVVIGFRISGKPADDQHPFGHQRAESIASIIISTLLGVVAFNFIIDSIRRLVQFQKAEYTGIAICVFLISVIVKEALAQFSLWAGKKTNSSSLTADGWHHRSDAIASAVIVIGAMLSSGFWWIDGVLGILVSLMIFYAAYQILRESTKHLLGESIDRELESKIRRTISEIAPEVINVHHFHLHRYGDHIELTFHICMLPDIKLNEAHRIANIIEEKIRNDFNIESTIHMECEENPRG